MELTIYTDGSWNNISKAGGWAFTIESNEEHFIEESGYSLKTTNNRMELNAIIQALLYVKDKIQSKGYKIEKVTLNTDSAYCLKMLKREDNSLNFDEVHPKVKNATMINYARNLIKGFCCDITLNHIAGHSNSQGNDYVDRLAVRSRFDAERVIRETRENRYNRKNTVSIP